MVITGARKAGETVKRQLDRIVGRQAVYAAERALNDTVYTVARDMRDKMPQYIDRPIPTTQRSIMYEKSTKLALRAAVYMLNEGSKGKLPPTKYMQYQVYGGGRRAKAFENALRSAGVLLPGEYAIPTRAVRLDQYGNVPGSFINLVLSYFQAFGRYAGDMNNMSAKRKAQLAAERKLKAKVRKRDPSRPGYSAFAVEKERYRYATTLGSRLRSGQQLGRLFIGGRGREGRAYRHLKPGIYSATGIGGSNIKPLFIFTRQPFYGRRYPFHRIVLAEAKQRFSEFFPRRFAEAIATMRK